MTLITVNQYPVGTVVEASKTEGFTALVTGKIASLITDKDDLLVRLHAVREKLKA